MTTQVGERDGQTTTNNAVRNDLQMYWDVLKMNRHNVLWYAYEVFQKKKLKLQKLSK